MFPHSFVHFEVPLFEQLAIYKKRHEVIVKSRCKYNTTQVQGAAEDVGITAVLYKHIRDLTGFYPMH